MSELKVNKESFKSFFSNFLNNGCKLKIPDYQREYVWNDDNFTRLSEDLLDYISTRKEEELKEYYLGNIVLYFENENKVYEIVDGQQRITTFLIIDFIINLEDSYLKNSSFNVDFPFKSRLSRYNIKKCQNYFFNKGLKENNFVELISRAIDEIRFITITTESQDDAFNLFDTQNNRGLKPKITDLLKAVHLRNVIDSEKLGESLAKKWEFIEKYEKNKNNKVNGEILPWLKHFFMYEFVKTVLWRARTWKFGNADFADDEGIEKEFFKNLSEAKSNTFKTYPEFNNSINCEIQCDDNRDALIVTSVLPSKIRDYPISLRQPLVQGVCFFKYIEKYFEILRFIFEDESQKEFQIFFNRVYANQSIYIKQAFVTAVLIYIDKYGIGKLLNFILCWDYATGHLRLFSYSIRENTLPNYIKKRQLFDKIYYSYSQEELFKELLTQIPANNLNLGSPSNPMKDYNNDFISYIAGKWNHKKNVFTEFNTPKEITVNELRNNYDNKHKFLIEIFFTK
ncbi:MAG: DUF262 domain-containing protein [Bacteroidales bacterium]|nr:DUF262 domain-containing protein [Bacteroidales bacterium]